MINENNFTTRERIACKILCHLKHDEVNIIPCKYNDFLLNATKNIIKVDPYTIFAKVTNEIKSVVST